MALGSRIVAAALGLGLALTAGIPTASAGTFHPDPFPGVVSLGTPAAHCLEIALGNHDNGATAQQWDCWGGANQRWSLTAGPAGSLVNLDSGKCLETPLGNHDNGAPVRQWDCWGGPNQQWYWTRIKGSGYTLRNADSGKCLEIALGDYSNGATARQWDCWNGDNQDWFPLG
ncbi:RICIN domain-containing protein [Kitasatospora sp. NPDC057198]|uniref:RICIN domain-containing protein n=1 Tax=Kitasatospora sp. NPDC057198 TaxID=3346046 RepID=UPI00362E1D72